MRHIITRKKMQKTVPKTGIQITGVRITMAATGCIMPDSAYGAYATNYRITCNRGRRPMTWQND